MCDSKGLVTISRGDELPKHKQVMARRDDTPNMKDLKDIVAHVKPHAIVGLTGGGEAWGKVHDALVLTYCLLLCTLCCMYGTPNMKEMRDIAAHENLTPLWD